MEQLKIKTVSSLEKCFFDERIDDKTEKREFTIFKNEPLTFQVIYTNTLKTKPILRAAVRLSGSLAQYATVRQVVHIPSMQPMNQNFQEGAYLRREPGMYPDLLRPLHYNDGTMLPMNRLRALFVEVRLPEDFSAGEYDLSVKIDTESEPRVCGETSVSVKVLDVCLPPQELIHTEWLYTDCIANHYGVKAFSEKHWSLIESFIKTAVDNGINMILTPVFTPELDTYVGGERLTTQLVDISLGDDGRYIFGFEKLHRWIDMCERLGVKYYEIPHFFTQWGAAHAPKIIVKVKGRKRKYFGWHTDSAGEEYADFLSQFIPALVGEFKRRGVDKNCYYHVSDEPHLPDLEQYKRCKELIAPYLEGYHIIDALSDYEFYESGALDKPVPATKAIAPFIEHKVEGLWAYYCQSGTAVSDRFFSMPLWRTRILGVQLYLYDIEGFLHWGYNFYNNKYSYDVIDPFGDSSGEYFVASGDTYLVYPGNDGTAWGSLRLNAMREAMEDIRALKLYESLFGREAAKALVMEGTDGRLDFLHYPQSAEYILGLREKIYKAAESVSVD
ncbi:MAG: DUF4091 domain-containing protein [Clostridia bacterium]|nr:DUF4091 domain-containing protein [Clostridia bacterium]